MKVTIFFHGNLRNQFCCDVESLDIPEGSTTGSLVVGVMTRYRKNKNCDAINIAVNGMNTENIHELCEGDCVALREH